MGENYKNAAEFVYYTLASVLVAMQIQEMLKRQEKSKQQKQQKKKPPKNRKSRKRK